MARHPLGRHPMSGSANEATVASILDIAAAAGRVILGYYRTDVAARAKSDLSPVTVADEEAERLILERLRDLAPGTPIVSEEAFARGEIAAHAPERFWLVDPLDGTKEFLNRNGEFTVNIALIVAGAPVLGVVAAPALSLAYSGAGPGTALEWCDGQSRAIRTRAPEHGPLVVVASRSHGDPGRLEQWIDRVKARRAAAGHPSEIATRSAGSSLKFCLVAAGQADLYPRFGRTMEWDTAAGHAVLAAAGGTVLTTAGHKLPYGKPGFENPHFLALSTLALAETAVQSAEANK
jgi:3'(2'), 5'-bisphosphate nucleotidase